MSRKFQVGDDVAHKTDTETRMTVVTYTSDGKVVCRGREKSGFKNEEFLEQELEKWVDTPCISSGRMTAAMDTDKYNW